MRNPLAWRPKLPEGLAEFARLYLPRGTPAFWVWSAGACILTFIAMLLVAKIFLSGSNLRSQAVEIGQRAFVHIATGEIEGNIRHTKAEEPSTPPGSAAPDAGTIVSKEGLAPAPLVSISAQTENGLVPIVGHDGTIPWKYYARPYAGKEKHPLVAILITNLGLSRPLTEDTLKLPHNFTLGFSPYAGDARKWNKKAREEGFETLVDLPMQSTGYPQSGSDAGPYGLMADASAGENSARLRWVLSRFPGYVGLLAPQDEALTPELATIRPVLIELAGHGVLFLYVKTPKNAGLVDLAKARQFPVLGIDKVIDEEIAPGPIDKQLMGLVALAKAQGTAIGLAHSYPPTLEALTRWADSLGAQGVELVPVSAIAMQQLP